MNILILVIILIGMACQIKIKAHRLAYSDDQQVYRFSLMFNKLELPLGCYNKKSTCFYKTIVACAID